MLLLAFGSLLGALFVPLQFSKNREMRPVARSMVSYHGNVSVSIILSQWLALTMHRGNRAWMINFEASHQAPNSIARYTTEHLLVVAMMSSVRLALELDKAYMKLRL